MSGFLTWFCVGMGMLIAAFFWFSYLVKIVFNDELVQERRRRKMRVRELEHRQQEDAARKRGGRK